jgi:hypothetical protein
MDLQTRHPVTKIVRDVATVLVRIEMQLKNIIKTIVYDLFVNLLPRRLQLVQLLLDS